MPRMNRGIQSTQNIRSGAMPNEFSSAFGPFPAGEAQKPPFSNRALFSREVFTLNRTGADGRASSRQARPGAFFCSPSRIYRSNAISQIWNESTRAGLARWQRRSLPQLLHALLHLRRNLDDSRPRPREAFAGPFARS